MINTNLLDFSSLRKIKKKLGKTAQNIHADQPLLLELKLRIITEILETCIKINFQKRKAINLNILVFLS